MQLTYRGISYDYTPPAVEMKLGEFSGRYRGLDWRFCNAQKSYVQQPSVDLMYRGISYSTNPSVGESSLAESSVAESTPSAPVTIPVAGTIDRTRDVIMRHQRSLKNREQSMLTRLSAEVGLLT